MLGPYCGGVCQVEVALTLLKLTETCRRTGGRAGTSKYRDACASKKIKMQVFFIVTLCPEYFPRENSVLDIDRKEGEGGKPRRMSENFIHLSRMFEEGSIRDDRGRH